MKPTEAQIQKLKALEGDDECYHSCFDDMLEERLMQFDPEWMKAMSKIYDDSNCARWCA